MRRFAVFLTIALLALGGRGATFSTVCTFGPSNAPGVNALVIAGDVIYATGTVDSNSFGALFRVNCDGTDFTNLHNFSPSTGGPVPGLLVVGSNIYGASDGDSTNDGAVFKIGTDGSGFTMSSLWGTNGAEPVGGPVLCGDMLYEATRHGGGSNDYGGTGAIFQADLADLQNTQTFDFPSFKYLLGGLTGGSNVVYGYNDSGGTNGLGQLYSVGIDGTFRDVLDFSSSNGWYPVGTPTLIGNTFYGGNYDGGTNGYGALFRVDTDGSHFTNLYNFTAADGVDPLYVAVFDGKFYGTSLFGGTNDGAAIFSVNLDGSGLTVLHSFPTNEGNEIESLAFSNGTLYGITQGAIFAMAVEPTLSIALSGGEAVLSWNDPSYSLYAAASLTDSFTQVPGATSPYTNATTGQAEFFRLK